MGLDQSVTLFGGRNAAADYSTYTNGEPDKQFLGVDVDSSGNIAIVSANGQRCIGVLYNTPASGQEAEVAVAGVPKVVYGGSVTAGDSLKVNSAAKFVTATAAEVAAGYSVAVAIKTGSTNERHRVVWTGRGGVATTTAETIASGAASILTSVTWIQIDGTKAYTLADGLYDGQQKWIIAITATNTPAGTVTPAHMAEGSSHTLSYNAVGDAALLVWSALEATPTWHCVVATSVTIN